MSIGGKANRGTPSPAEWLKAFRFKDAGDSRDPRTLYVGAAYVNGTDISVRVPVAGASRVRFRFTGSGAGTLKAFFCSADGVDRYSDSKNPANVVIVGGTQNVIETDQVFGEGYMEFVFTPGADGTVSVADFSAI